VAKYRDKMRVYCDCHTEEEADPEACADEAERVVDELGYDALKFDLDVPSGFEKDRANRHLPPGMRSTRRRSSRRSPSA